MNFNMTTYTRDEAVADGLIVDVSQIAQEFGIKAPVAVSDSLFKHYLSNRGLKRQDRIQEVLKAFREKVIELKEMGEDTTFVEFVVRLPRRRLQLWAIAERNPTPSIRISLPKSFGTHIKIARTEFERF